MMCFSKNLNLKRFMLIGLMTIFFIGCTTKKATKVATLNFTLKKINVVETFSAFALNDSTSLLTVSSLKIPVRGIVLENSGTGSRAEIYKCQANKNDDCLIELASSNQLTDLLSAPEVKINIGNFDTVALYHCFEEGGYTSFVNASVTDGSLTFYTHANGIVDTNATDAAAISILNRGCLTKHTLHKEVVFVDKATMNLQFYVDTRNMVWMGLSKDSPGWFASQCSGDFDFDDRVNDAFVCTAGMDLAGTELIDVPIVERYRLNNIGIVGLYFNGDGVTSGDGSIIGGYTRRFYSAGFDPATLPVTDVFTPVLDFKAFSLNDDSTITLSTYAPEGASAGYLNISNFERSVTGGSLNGSFTNEAGILGSYNSVRID